MVQTEAEPNVIFRTVDPVFYKMNVIKSVIRS